MRLLRLRIVSMVLFAMGVAAAATAPGGVPWPALLHALVGTGLVIGGAVSLNQRLERDVDARMARTASRPLPAGRLTTVQVTRFGLLLSVLGVVYLSLFSSGMVTALAAASWVIYVLVYTPMKSQTAWQTPVGAVSGAMPVLLGAAAVGSLMTPLAALLFGIVFFWQFPHSMAIAWLYRDQFAAAGVKLVTTVDPTGRRAGMMAVAGGMALVLLGGTPLAFERVGPVGPLIAVALGLLYLAAAVLFHTRPDDRSARRLLRASLIYLPLVLLAMLA